MAFSTHNHKYYTILKDIIFSIVDVDRVMVFMFGSRASGYHGARPDVDIGLLADENLPEKVFHQIRNAIDDSVVPWKVDIVDFSRVDPEFKKEAMKKIVIWNQPASLKIK